ncbi:unnamed protein product [Nezara viridula]|uniref:Gustatory receptor n=1 Tax=Nezara viridula TaxID=85310 RepID=A0A9P0MNN8_NEZVI|nr:unnamed protein product [Nezara viridula]
MRWLGKPYCTEDSLPWWKAVIDILIISVITALSILVCIEDRTKHERISTFLSVLSIIGNNFLASNLILLNLRRDHPLGPVLKSIYSLPFSQPASNHIGWLLIGFCFVLANLLTDIFVFPMFKVVKLFPVFYLSDVLIYLFLAQFIIPLLMIGDRLSNISLSLRCLGKREPFESISQFDELFNVHRQLITHCTRLKQIYSWPLLVIVASKLFGATASESITSFLEQRISLSFSAHGFFGLDHSLFRSILATIASYLFIIIQFQIRSNIEEKRALHIKHHSLSHKL